MRLPESKKILAAISSDTFKGISSSTVSSIIQAVLQVFLVPIYLTNLGIGLYGEWIVLFTMANLLSLCDFGIGVVLSNEYLNRFSRDLDDGGNLVTVVNTYLSIFVFVIFVTLLCIIYLFCDTIIAEFKYGLSIANIVGILIYHLLNILISVPNGLFRTYNRYAEWVNITSTYRLIEGFVIFSVLELSQNTGLLIFAMVLVKFVYAIVLQKKIVKISNYSFFSFSSLREYDKLKILQKSILGLSLNNIFQNVFTGIFPAVITNLFGSIFFVQYNSLRTLVNAFRMVYGVICAAIWRDLAIEFSRGNRFRLKKIITQYEFVILSMAVLFIIFLTIFGELIFEKWLGSQLEFDHKNFVYLTIAVFIASIFSVRHTLLLAINKTTKLSMFLLLSNLILFSVVVCSSLFFDANLTGIGIVLYEMTLCFYVFYETHNLLAKMTSDEII